MSTLDFKKGDGLIPAVVQDSATNKVLMVGYMNEEALHVTKESGKVTFFSRSKNRLWTKGETSGNFLNLEEVLVDCDGDTLLIKARPDGPACHTGADTCFNEVNDSTIAFLERLTKVIEDRKNNPSESSYTSSLFKKGVNKLSQKVGEEAVEVVIEAMDDNLELLKSESADLLFHLMVLLSSKGLSLRDVVKVLADRHK
jgi:phosphoribosyl-ATP pyrophosphohydrolase/phosphoribosyl-AMP cyclohydrolase